MNDLRQISPYELWGRFRFLRDAVVPFVLMHEVLVKPQYAQEAQSLRQAFSTALEQWSDAEIKEFLCECFFDRPASEELDEETPERRRRILEMLYGVIIKGEPIDRYKS